LKFPGFLLQETPIREVTIGAATLILADCRDVLPRIADQIGAIISDPPYGIGYRYGGGGNGRHRRRNMAAIVGDDSPFDLTPFVAFDNVLLWGANHFAAQIPQGGRWLAWDKLAGMSPWDGFSDVEFAWHSRRGASRIFAMRWKGIIRGEGNGESRVHPSQKPIALMRWCVEQCDAPGTICDPYMGSGTTGIACAQLCRRFIGIEIEPRWFDIACERIEAAQRAAAA
jgi:site-specific DNA-methyltransferase (adenine-specific)/modification methylase